MSKLTFMFFLSCWSQEVALPLCALLWCKLALHKTTVWHSFLLQFVDVLASAHFGQLMLETWELHYSTYL